MHNTRPLSPKGDILIVDDTPENLRLLIDMLTQSTHKVRPALSGQLALSAAQASPPDLILLDIMMPEMDGYQVCRQLKADNRTRHIPVIFLSAMDQPLDKLKAFETGAVDYITKPFHTAEALARIETHLTLHKLQQDFLIRNRQLEQEIAKREQVEAEERRQRQLAESLRVVANILNRSLDLETVLTKIMEQLRWVIPYDSGALFLQDGEDLRIVEGVGLDTVVIDYRIPISSSRPVARAFRQKQPLVIADVLADADWKVLAASEQIRGWMGAPLMVGNRAIGLLTADSFVEGAYSQKDVQILQSFANQAAIAIENAQLYQQAQYEIDERRRAEQQLQHMALHDALTNLPNRILFTERLEQAIQKQQQSSAYLFAVLFIDLDRFKNINDSLGHLLGDELLLTIARRLEQCTRPGDTVARLGGDEFAILLDNLSDLPEAEQVAERIRHEFTLPLSLGGHQIFTTASIGIVRGSLKYQRPNDLLRDADTAMYQAKAKGKARHALFETAQHTRVMDRWRLETDLWQAIKEWHEFEVYYQPILSLTTYQIIGVEALLRWQHPRRGILEPDKFLELAEETGLIIPLGEWLLKTACAQTQSWRQAGFPSLRLAVNISARQLRQPNLAAFIRNILAETQLPPQALELEINENVSAQHMDLSCLTELQALGIKISLDDFGISSSLSTLKYLSLDTLKIDQSFIKGVSHNINDRTIVSAMISVARNLNLEVVAEGVETEAQLNFLQGQQCDQVQGYLLSPPVPALALTDLLHSAGNNQLFLSNSNNSLELPIRAQASKHMGYALADENLKVILSNTKFNQWVEGQPDNLVGQFLPHLFPELIGAEDNLSQLVYKRGETFTLAKIYRSSVAEQEVPDDFGFYFDLQLEPFLGRDTTLLVTAIDVTEQAYLEFELRQERNELRLLLAQKALEEERSPQR